MPLHKPKGLGAYQQQLSYCVTQVSTFLIPAQSSMYHDDTPWYMSLYHMTSIACNERVYCKEGAAVCISCGGCLCWQTVLLT